MNKNKLRHLAIIVDGNGRWATERGLSRSKGHEAGLQRLQQLTEYIRKKNIEVLSLYLFSTENFKREKKEVEHLMHLLKTEFRKWSNKLYKEDVKIIFSGRKEPLEEDIILMEQEVMEKTKNNKGLLINFCINYGGHAEITDACLKVVQEVMQGKMDIEDIDENKIASFLYQDLPPVDLMIRTSGEKRISNFLLWQISYAELDFPNVNFPDFTNEELEKAIARYEVKNRRFGGNNNENKSY